MVLSQDPKAYIQTIDDVKVHTVASALTDFSGSAKALQALEDHLDEPSVLLKLCQNVGKQDVLQRFTANTVYSLSDAFVLGRKHQSRGVPLPDTITQKKGLTARLLGNPHLKAYAAGYFTWPRNRVNVDELQQLCLLAGKTLPQECCKAAIASFDSMPWLTRLPAIHSQDLERLCSVALSPTDQRLQQCAQESVAEDLRTMGIVQSPKQAARESRLAETQANAAFVSAQKIQCNLCLAKTISWARDQGAAMLCRSQETQRSELASVKMVIDTSDIVETCIAEDSSSKKIRVDLALNVTMPSPAISFGALNSGSTCTVLECLLALHTAGIQMQLWEVVLLATRYSALGSGTTYSWAADIRWPALLRDLGFSPDSSIPAGKTASLTDIADLLTMRPPDGTLTDVQQQQVNKHVWDWEISARRSLEAVCGHSIDSANLFPYLKLAPRAGPRTFATQAVQLHIQPDCTVKKNNCSEAPHDAANDDNGQARFTMNHPSDDKHDETPHKVEISFPVRVFLVAQEPIGHLKACVHVNIEVGDVLPDKKHHCINKSIAEKMHPVFDLPILLIWASQQLKVFKLLKRMFSTMDPNSTGACSLRDTKYVFSTVFGRFPSLEQQETLFKAFTGPPVRDTASRVAGTHERFRYKDFMCTIKPAHVLLLHQKQQTPVLPQDTCCPLYTMCILSKRVLPGVSTIHKTLVGASSGSERMGQQLLDFATFKSAARTVLSCNEQDVDALMNACRAVGSKNVCVDMVEWLLCIRLERCMSQIVADENMNE